jgi:hypothetical protein
LTKKKRKHPTGVEAFFSDRPFRINERIYYATENAGLV